ncbi:hypothetical protein DXC87_01605 [Blautia obeum]|nr:hypothetical protein DXC87_01605 [Blautia obeum]
MQRKQDKDTLIKLQASSSVIERKTRCNHQAASILKSHRKKKQDAITGLQASSIAIERKNKMQSPVCKHLQLP